MCTAAYYLCGVCNYTLDAEISQCHAAIQFGEHRFVEAYGTYQGTMGREECQPTYKRFSCILPKPPLTHVSHDGASTSFRERTCI
jgi:hypothetical protein